VRRVNRNAEGSTAQSLKQVLTSLLQTQASLLADHGAHPKKRERIAA
jgi:hypothetical protein